MGIELAAFRFGAASYPLTEATTNTLLEDADPAIARAIPYLAAMCEYYFGERLLRECERHSLRLPRAVVATAAIEPEPSLFADQFQFPMLTLYRVKDVWDEATIAYDKSTAIWEFSYLLPPLTPVQARAIQPILRAASVTLRRVIHLGQHKDYKNNEPVWANAGIHKARLVEAVYGTWEKVDNVDKYYRALTGTISVMERELPRPDAYDDIEGTDATIDQRASDGTLVPSVAEVTVEGPPSLVSISPTTGSSSGSTLVTVTGTGFRPGTHAVVLFDGAAADAVTIVNETTVTCRTPAHAAYPSFTADVVFIAADKQVATLKGAFTFNGP